MMTVLYSTVLLLAEVSHPVLVPWAHYTEVPACKLLNVSFSQRASHVVAIRIHGVDLSVVAQEGDAPTMDFLQGHGGIPHLEIYSQPGGAAYRQAPSAIWRCPKSRS